MKLKKIAQLVTAVVVASGLAACAGNKGDVGYHRSPPSNNLVGNKVARAYGVSGDKAYQVAVANDQGRRDVNSLKAPSNQTYYFDYDQNKMHNDDYQALMIQARYLASHPNATIRLDGNTDDRGSREYNVGLGWRRDQSVQSLLEQQGVSPKQIQMVSYGKERPAVLGENERSWSLNRRVNLIYKVY